MTPDQQSHVERIGLEFWRLVRAKYEKGALEHGGNLWQYPSLELLDQAIGETIDQFTYLFTLREQLREEQFKQELLTKPGNAQILPLSGKG